MPGNVSFRAERAREKHPELESRKRLAALLLAARSLHLPSASAEQRELVDDLLRSADRVARDVGLLRDSSISLDLFLRSMADEVERQYRGQERLPAASSIRELVARLRHNAENVDCLRCVQHSPGPSRQFLPLGRSEKVCQGDPALDLENMRNGAVCWQPFQNLFRFALLTAQEAYDAVLPTDCRIDLDFEFHTCGTREPALGAKTLFPSTDRPNARRTIVQITLPEDHFNFEHFAALLYLIFHEVCVHGPQAWYVAGKRDGTPEDCPFREGFVDAAAAEILEDALHNRVAALAPDLQPFADDIARKTKAEHNRRSDVTPEEANPDTRKTSTIRRIRQQRARGVKIFERLRKRVQINGSQPTGHLAIRLALCANVLDLSDAALIDLVEQLDRVTDLKLHFSQDRQSRYQRLKDLVSAPSPRLSEIKALILQKFDTKEF